MKTEQSPSGRYTLAVTTIPGWCPDFTGSDGRICRRIVNRSRVREKDVTIDLEWGKNSAPILVQIYLDGKTGEKKWYPRSVEGMNEALNYALSLLK